jgi:hypothetical protein
MVWLACSTKILLERREYHGYHDVQNNMFAKTSRSTKINNYGKGTQRHLIHLMVWLLVSSCHHKPQALQDFDVQRLQFLASCPKSCHPSVAGLKVRSKEMILLFSRNFHFNFALLVIFCDDILLVIRNQEGYNKVGLAWMVKFLVVEPIQPNSNLRFDIAIVYLQLLSVVGNVPVDSETLLMTDFMNLKIKSTQSIRCAHRDMMYVRVFIAECSYVYKYLRLYCVSNTKKISGYKLFF